MLVIDYIVLENLTKGFACPSVMDVKIGKITHLPSFSQKKIDECIEKARTSTQSSDAYRICGMQVRHPYLEETVRKDCFKYVYFAKHCIFFLSFLLLLSSFNIKASVGV